MCLEHPKCRKTPCAWYADFFTELPNAFWRAATPPELTSTEVDFIVRVAGLRPGSRVLDVPCGSGRHALELARRGCRVTGQDISAEAIEYARKATADEQLDLDLRLGDMRTLPTDVRADAAVCLGNSFGYLEHADTRQFLANLAGLTVPGGAASRPPRSTSTRPRLAVCSSGSLSAAARKPTREHASSTSTPQRRSPDWSPPPDSTVSSYVVTSTARRSNSAVSDCSWWHGGLNPGPIFGGGASTRGSAIEEGQLASPAQHHHIAACLVCAAQVQSKCGNA